MPDRQTLEAYRRRAGDYADRFATDAADPGLDAFMAALPLPAHVLDFGCGPGHAAAQMRDAGHAVDALDASPEMAAEARSRFGLKVRVADFDVPLAAAAYDGVWANFSLLHAPKADFPRHLAALHKALKSGGILHLGMKLGTGETRDRFGRFYAWYRREELTGLLEAAGFETVDETEGHGAGLEGTVSPMILILVRRQP